MAEENIQVLSSLLKAMDFHLAEMKKAYERRDIEKLEQSKKNILETQSKIKDILR